MVYNLPVLGWIEPVDYFDGDVVEENVCFKRGETRCHEEAEVADRSARVGISGAATQFASGTWS